MFICEYKIPNEWPDIDVDFFFPNQYSRTYAYSKRHQLCEVYMSHSFPGCFESDVMRKAF